MVNPITTSRRFSKFLLVSVVGVTVCCTQNQLAAQTSLKAQVIRFAKPYIDSGTVSGLSICVLKGDQEATVHLGKTASDGKRPNDATVYEIGSISKVFTSLLLADAVVDKELRLDQDVQDLLPDNVTMPKWKDKSVSLLHLSTHTSGLPRLPDNMPFSNPKNPYVDYSSDLAHAFLNKYELTRAPGAEYAYSNFGAALLGHMICDNANLSYDELLQSEIVEPLGLRSTSVQLTKAMKRRFATPHSDADTQTVAWDFADMPGAGGIRSTTRDMLDFAKANLAPPTGPIGKAIELAWKEHAAVGPKMGLGWHFAGDGETRWHNGQTGGFHSMLMLNRAENVGVVLLANTASKEVDQLGNTLMQFLAGDDVKPQVFEKEVAIDDEVLQRYVGKYELAPTFVFTVSVDNGKLMVGITNQPTHRVFPKSETVWFYKVVPAELTFKVNKRGKCTALELFQNGIRQTAKRVK